MGYLQEIQDVLLKNINPDIFSTDYAKSVLFFLFGIGIAVFVFRTLKKAICWWLGLIFFMEIMHFIAFQTIFGTQYPILQELFKYDVLSMLAQIFVGTKLCEWILYARAFLEATVGTAVMMLYHFLLWLIDYIKVYTPFLK